MGQQRCCIIGACCAPFSAEQETALADYLFESMYPDQGTTPLRELDVQLEEAALRQACRRAAKKLYADRLIVQVA